MKLAGLSNNAVKRIQGSIKGQLAEEPKPGPKLKHAQEDGTGGQAYWKTVKSIAQSIKEEWMQDNSLDVQQRVFEEVDGNHYVIYYDANIDVLKNSPNDEAYEDMGVELDTSKGWRNILTQVAFYALEADINEALDELGWDGTGFEQEEEDF